MMKRLFPFLLLLLGMALLIGLSSCNSKKKAADAAAAQTEKKYQQADRDKKAFESVMPAATE